MAKATVLRCDLCSTWDEPANRVISVPVVGPRFELCKHCRIAVIASTGADKLKAQAYVEAYDARLQGDTGKLQFNGAVVRELAEKLAAQAQLAEPAPNGEPDVPALAAVPDPSVHAEEGDPGAPLGDGGRPDETRGGEVDVIDSGLDRAEREAETGGEQAESGTSRGRAGRSRKS